MKPKNSKIPLLMIGLGGLLLAAAAIWLASGGLEGTAPRPTTEEEVQRISLEDAYAAYQAGEAVFLDVRGAESYESARIPGAVNIPLEKLAARLNELSKEAWILTYCT